MQIRTSLNIEANDLRMLSVMIDSVPDELRDIKNRLRTYLIQYATRVMKECEPGLSFDNQKLMGSIDSEINGFLRLVNSVGISQYSTMYVDTMLPVADYQVDDSMFDPVQKELNLSSRQRQTSAPFLPPYIISEIYDGLTRLRHERSVRLSALQSTYPPLHYAILALLGASICGIDPFRGSYNVAVSVNQFFTIREAIRSMIRMDKGDENGGSIPNGENKKLSETDIINSILPPGDGTLWL
eukprot:scaffold8871_cov90-Cyclotella_meneghiniana.AAC.3